MEQLINFFNSLGLDWGIILMYVCAGIIVKNYFDNNWSIPFSKRTITTAWKTLIVGTIIVMIYVLIDRGSIDKIDQADIRKIFITYIFTTSFYELVLKDTIVQFIVNIIQKFKPSAPAIPEQRQ